MILLAGACEKERDTVLSIVQMQWTIRECRQTDYSPQFVGPFPIHLLLERETKSFDDQNSFL